MKKYIISAILIYSFINKAQSEDNSKLFISPGIGIGAYNYGYAWGFTLPVLVNLDVKVSDKFSIGAYASRWRNSWDYNFIGSYKFTSTHIGARGSFHFWKWLDNELEDFNLKSDKYDVYLTAWGGFNARTAKWAGNNLGNNDPFVVKDFDNRVQVGLQLGARYRVNKHLALFTEWGGTPTSWSNFGLTFKF